MKGLVPLVEEVFQELENKVNSLAQDVEFYKTFENSTDETGLEESISKTSDMLIKKLESLLDEQVSVESDIDKTCMSYFLIIRS